MRNFNRLGFSCSLQLIAVLAAMGLMQDPAAAASDYCIGKGVEAARSCISDLTPKGGGLAAVMAAKITEKDKARCEQAGHDTQNNCEKKSLLVTDQGSARCDLDYCWAIVKTVRYPSLCAKVSRSRLAGDRLSDGKLKLVDYVLEGDTEALKREACPDEMLDGAARDDGLEMLPLTATAGWSCIIASDDDSPKWADSYCYGIFRMGDDVVCGRAKKDRVAPVRLSGAPDRRYIITSKFYECPRSVWQNYNRWKGDKDMEGALDSPGGKLSPVPAGRSPKPESTITGVRPDDVPPPAVDTVNIDVDIDIGVDGRHGGRYYGGREHGGPGARPVHSGPTKPGPPGHPPSTITGPGAPPPPVAHPPSPTPKPAPVAGPPPAPPPVPGPIAGPPPIGGAPHGVKIDAAPTGHNADLSDIRGKVLNIAPKDD